MVATVAAPVDAVRLGYEDTTAGGFGSLAVGEAGGVFAMASRLSVSARAAWMTYAVPLLAAGGKFVSGVR